MPLMNPALIPAEMLRRFIADRDTGRVLYAASLMRFLGNGTRMFYCPTCDRMVTIVKPIARFRPQPWRDDVFKWST